MEFALFPELEIIIMVVCYLSIAITVIFAFFHCLHFILYRKPIIVYLPNTPAPVKERSPSQDHLSHYSSPRSLPCTPVNEAIYSTVNETRKKKFRK